MSRKKCMYEQFGYFLHLGVYPNSTDMNELYAIAGLGFKYNTKR